MLSGFFAETTLLNYAEEISRLDKGHSTLLRLTLKLLLIDHLFKESLCGNVMLHKVHHQISHNFERFLVQLSKIKSILFFFIFIILWFLLIVVFLFWNFNRLCISHILIFLLLCDMVTHLV